MEGEYSSESMMQQAQQVWSMLDDMADNDPSAYKAFIDKQMVERNNFMAPPEPHMCVKTEMVKPEKVNFYMNFCSWKRIPPPANSEEPVKVAGSAISRIKDGKGVKTVTSVAFNEKILDECGKNPVNKEDQHVLIQIAMDFIEKQNPDILLNRNYKILEQSHMGSVKFLQESLQQSFKSKNKEHEDSVESVLKQFAPSNIEIPSELNKDTDDISGITLNTKPVKKGLIEEVSSTAVTLPEPHFDLNIVHTESNTSKKLVLKIYLPNVKSVSQCELDISQEDVYLFVEGEYELKLSLPCHIVYKEAAAKFIKKSETLSIAMPIKE